MLNHAGFLSSFMAASSPKLFRLEEPKRLHSCMPHRTQSTVFLKPPYDKADFQVTIAFVVWQESGI